MKAAHLTCLLFLLSLPRLHAADPTTDYTWDSPDKRFRATWTVDQVRDLSSFKITSLTDPDPSARPLLEGGGGAPAPDGPKPGLIGVWGADGRHLAVYMVSKGQTLTGGYQFGTQLYGYLDATANAPARFEFVSDNSHLYPERMDSEVIDRLSRLQADVDKKMLGAFAMTACRWKGDRLVESDDQFDLTVETENHEKFSYRAKWTVTSRLTETGFVFEDMSPISYTQLDASGKEGAWKTLSITEQDRLRIAVRRNLPSAVSALLAKGVDPNKDPAVNLATLAAQAEGAQELALLLKAGTDINRNPAGSSRSLANAAMAADPSILEEMLAGKPSGDNASSFYVYAALVESLPLLELFAQQTGKAGPADEEEAFLRKLKLLATAKFDINAADEKTGRTALMFAVQGHLSVKLIQALLDAGADPYKKDGVGKTAVDLAADSRQLPVLRLLDARHQYADLEKSYEIPANSVYVGTWGREDFAIRLSADGTGVLATLFPGIISWKEVGGVAQIEVRLPTSNQPKMVMKGTARLGADSDTLILTVDQLTNPQGQTLHREKSKLAH